MKYQHKIREVSRATYYYYPRSKSVALESARAVLGAIILLILAPLLFSVAGGSFGLFGLVVAVEFVGVVLGVFKFMRPPRGLPPLIPGNTAPRSLDVKDDLKRAA